MNDVDAKEETAPKRSSKVKWLVVMAILLIPGSLIAAHEISLRRFQDLVCVTCHEMKEPVQKWKDSGTAKNHQNCAGCHFDKGFKGWLSAYESAVVQVVEHFRRDPDEPIALPDEPLFLEENKEPGYWSLVPNHRCFQCHDAPNHKEIDQPRIHAKLVKKIASQPCKDCHNHEMRKGQKFYEKVLTETSAEASTGQEQGVLSGDQS